MGSPLSYTRLTAPGRGAIIAALIRGPEAPRVRDRLFRPAREPTSDLETRARYGTFLDRHGEPLDDGLVIPTPFGEILTLHGNPLLLEALIDELEALGASEEEEVPFDDHGSRIRKESLALLPRARTEAAAAFLLEQGDLAARGLAGWAQRVADGHRPDTVELAGLLARAPWGRGLFEPSRVVLAGAPNAGKSTLFNALLGRDRVVTHPTPGTTRDLIEEEMLFGELPVRVVDGAGLREGEGAIEVEGIRRMREAMTRADLIVELIPPAGMAAARPGVTSTPESGLTLQILSRADQIGPPSPGVASDRRLRVSAETGEGLEALIEAACRRLVGDPELPRGEPVPFLARHTEILEKAHETARRGEDPGPELARL